MFFIIINSNTFKMTTIWRVMLNQSLWNQNKFRLDFLRCPEEVCRIPQSKGRCRMISCPKKGDIVKFVLNGKIVMTGIVDSNGFETGTSHQDDIYNKGKLRPHSTPTEFVWIIIKEVGLSENIRHTGQRTWVKISD